VIFPPWLSPFTRTGGFAVETEADPLAVKAVSPIDAKQTKERKKNENEQN
jgi:hypothetical protein